MDDKELRILQLELEISLLQAQRLAQQAILFCQLTPGFCIVEEFDDDPRDDETLEEYFERVW